MFSLFRNIFSALGRCLKKDDRVHVPVPGLPAAPPRGRQSASAKDVGPVDDQENLLAHAMRTQHILEQSMPRAEAEKRVREELKSLIRARAAGTERPLRG